MKNTIRPSINDDFKVKEEVNFGFEEKNKDNRTDVRKNMVADTDNFTVQK
jgi:hypothetical protein